MKNNIKRYRAYIIIGVILLLVIILAAMPKNNINKSISMEAGGDLPEASVFFKNHIENAEYVTDMSGINLNEPGIHDVEVRSGKRSYIVKLEIKDTIPPVAEIKSVDIYESRTVEPSEFIENVNDVTSVSVTYKTEPDYGKTGNQEVFLVVEDTSGNRSEYKSILRISKVKEIAEVDINEIGRAHV